MIRNNLIRNLIEYLILQVGQIFSFIPFYSSHRLGRLILHHGSFASKRFRPSPFERGEKHRGIASSCSTSAACPIGRNLFQLIKPAMTPDNKVTLSVLTEEEGLHKASPCLPSSLPFLRRAHFPEPDNLVLLSYFLRRKSPYVFVPETTTLIFSRHPFSLIDSNSFPR